MSTTGLPEKPTITVAETARLLGIGRNVAYGLVREGRLRAVRIGRRILVPVSAVRELLDSNNN